MKAIVKNVQPHTMVIRAMLGPPWDPGEIILDYSRLDASMGTGV